jgi:hypothetical protein
LPVRLRLITAANAFAALLLIAATLKAIALVTNNAAISIWALGPIIIESILGFWLLSGLWSIWARHSSIVLITIFAMVSGWKWLTGHDNCGCFGNLRVHPAVTLAMDLVVGSVLVSFRPIEAKMPSRQWFRLIVSGVAAVAVFLSLLAVKAFQQKSGWQGDQVVFSNPQGWVGTRFPLLEHLVIPGLDAQALGRGDCTIVFYDHNCGRCRDTIAARSAEWREKARTQNNGAIVVNLAGSESYDPQLAELIHGQVKSNVICSFPLPVEIQLRNGLVARVLTP